MAYLLHLCGAILFLQLIWISAAYEYSVDDVNLYLYTVYNTEDPEFFPVSNFSKLSESTYFDPSKKNYFIIHGYQGNYHRETNTYIRPALIEKTDGNFFFPDWSPIAALNKTETEPGLKFVGDLLGNYIKQMKAAYNLTSKDFFVVGFSWGSQVAGATCSAADAEIEYLIGLDPASTQFTDNLIDENSAENVMFLSSSYVGVTTGSKGKANFYPNGGLVQPACDEGDESCLHQMAVRYFGESVLLGGFTGVKCDSYENFEAGLCDGNPTAKFGGLEPDKEASGDYYLKTNVVFPYSLDWNSS